MVLRGFLRGRDAAFEDVGRVYLVFYSTII